jgi:imidazolonepropionase
MKILIRNIKGLVQVRDLSQSFVAGKEMTALPILHNSFLLLSGGLIESFGPMDQIPAVLADEDIDATGKFVLPAFVDSHTHLVFAEWREEEYVMKIKGAKYEEIAANGGGILNSAKKLQQCSEEQLFQMALGRVDEIISSGTGAVEIKSGYGLTVADELKMLRVARRIGRETPLTVKTTFLGAHAVPLGVTKSDYIKLILDEMIPAIASENLADYIDVFCEQGFFSFDETVRICEAGKRFGMRPRIHANQLHRSGGVQAAVQVGAISADHLENIGVEEIELLKSAAHDRTVLMPTALPGAAFFLGLPFPPARAMLDAGLPLAIASDFNPGSSPSGNMSMMLALACTKMRMSPEEAINAATLNTAYALDLIASHGSITKGKEATVVVTKPIPSIAYIPYRFGLNILDRVIMKGKIVR